MQDSHKFDGKQHNKGVSVGVSVLGVAGLLPNIGGNIGKQYMNNDYLSVVEQSGIFAGDDGYQLII